MDIKTRILVISDTHADDCVLQNVQDLPAVDVAIHCGDLTEESKLREFKGALKLLRSINAPLKLVIAGNHDLSMDGPAFDKKIEETNRPGGSFVLDPEHIYREYGFPGEARAVFEDARKHGIIFLNEGTHRFVLDNGALLRVYASPSTGSPTGDGAFQYKLQDGHNYAVERRDFVDVVITHGPPKGILDRTESWKRAGCPDLFAAVCRARPRLHCFGHIHEGWGAKLVTWREIHPTCETPSHFTEIDNGKSTVIETLAGLRRDKFDTPEIAARKWEKLKRYADDGFCYAGFSFEDGNPLEQGMQTLFVNGAIQSLDEDKEQLPWIVDIDLPEAPPMEW